MKVEDVMTRDVKTVERRTTLKDAAALLAELRVSGLPVVENGRVVGVVSEADILFKERAGKPEDIAREIKDDVIVRSLWISPEEIDVEVEDGEVTIGGRVDTKADAELIPSFAERVPGVVSVASTLSWRSID